MPALSGATRAAPSSDRRAGLILVAAIGALMWVAEIGDQIAGGSLDQYGIEPREPEGLVGVATAPFLHAGFDHLISNTLPFLVLGALIALSGLARVAAATLIVAAVGGLGTWLIAPAGTEHIGASGIVFGYGSYLIVRSLFSRRLVHLATGVLVFVVYGTTFLFGLIPTAGVSWQGHLMGGVGGVVAARLLDRRARRPQRA